MDIQLRINQFLKVGEPGSPSLTAIAGSANMTRHELMHLLDEKATTINRKNLAKICRYLIDKKLVAEGKLPGILFTTFPEEFWSMLVERSRVELCLGARRDRRARDEYVSGADAGLQAELLFRITGSKPTERRRRRRSGPGQIESHVVSTWTQDLKNSRSVMREARQFHQRYLRDEADRALICLGSVKSNPVIELVMNGIFKRTRAFKSQDAVARPADRGCPVVMIYRSSDPPPPSCCGGRRLSGGTKKRPGKPGFYFEAEDSWRFVPCDDQSDGALVLYHFQPSRGRLEMVLGGFSGRSTRCLAAFLHSGGADELWPGSDVNSGGKVGAFVVEFKLGKASQGVADTRMSPYQSHEVHRIDEESLQRRLR